MKGFNFLTILLYLMTSLLLGSCSDSAPRDRPTISPFQATSGDDTGEDEEEVVEQEIPERPSAVFLQANACGCLAGEAITFGSNCPYLCEQK